MATPKDKKPVEYSKEPKLLSGGALIHEEMFASLLEFLGLDEFLGTRENIENVREAIPREAWEKLTNQQKGTASKIAFNWIVRALNRNSALPWDLEPAEGAIFKQGARKFLELNRARMNARHEKGKEDGHKGKGHKHPRARGNQNARKYRQDVSPYYASPEEQHKQWTRTPEEAAKIDRIEAGRPWEERAATFKIAFANWTQTEREPEKWALNWQDFKAIPALCSVNWQEEILHTAGQWSGTPAGQEAIKNATAASPFQLRPLIEQIIEETDRESIGLPEPREYARKMFEA